MADAAPEARAVTVTLELRIEGDSLSGRATDGDGELRPFTGWLGLLAVLDALCPPCARDGDG